MVCLITDVCMANSADPDQILHSAASDLDLHGLLSGLSVRIFMVNMVAHF